MVGDVAALPSVITEEPEATPVIVTTPEVSVEVTVATVVVPEVAYTVPKVAAFPSASLPEMVSVPVSPTPMCVFEETN
jgi:hypothetical protein